MWWCANKDPSIFPLMASLRTHEDWLRQKRTKFHYFHWCHWLHIFISFWINFYTLERTHVPIYAITQEYYHHRFLSFLVFLTTIAVQDCQAISVHYGLSNAIIRDQNFAKVCKSKTLFLAHFWAERAQFFFYRSKTAKSLQQVFFKYLFQQKNAKILAFNDKKPEGLVP